MCLILILNCCLFSFVFVSFSTKTFTFRKFPCAVQISQQNLYMGVCLVEDWGFRPGGVHSHFLPHNLYSFPVHIVGIPGEVSAPGQLSGFHQAAQNSFSGAFQNSNPNFHFYCPPHQHISIFKNQAPSKVKCHRTAFCRDQTVTERPVRPRVSAPTIMYIRAYVYLCHTPVTLIKSTYLLTY